MSDYHSRLEKCLDSLKKQLATVRTGRANPALLDRVMVDYYGTMTPLRQVASISSPEPMTLMLSVFDKTAIQNVEKAIQTSDLGLNPQVDGTNVILRIPPLTEDRRKEFSKIVRQYAEEARVAIRNVRRDEVDAIKAQEKEKEISADEAKKETDRIQKMTDESVHKIDEMVKHKEAEIFTV